MYKQTKSFCTRVKSKTKQAKPKLHVKIQVVNSWKEGQPHRVEIGKGKHRQLDPLYVKPKQLEVLEISRKQQTMRTRHAKTLIFLLLSRSVSFDLPLSSRSNKDKMLNLPAPSCIPVQNSTQQITDRD
jgi:hypothetical protein